MWDRHGVKLTSPIEVTKDILDKVHLQNEVCDLIWAINAVNQGNKSPENLSNTVMDEIKKLAASLLHHKCFKKYSTAAEVENRADRHFSGDHVMPQRFIQRQPKIENVFKYNVNNVMKMESSRRAVTHMVVPSQTVLSDIDDEDIKI